MPDTETIELRTDTIDQLIGLLEMQELGVHDFPTDRRMAVADRLKRQTSKPDAVALCGLPGAGKTHTAKKLSKVYDASVVSMGDAIRDNFPEEEYTSDQLADFAADVRHNEPSRIPKWVTAIVDQRASRPAGDDLFIIDGVRSVTDYDVLDDYFDNLHLIEIEAEFYHRLSRLQNRGREDEASFDGVDLAERDQKELDHLGFSVLKDGDYIDLKLKNGTGPDKLPIGLSSVVEHNLPYDIEDGRPLGLDDELEEVRQSIRT